jgi:hypothetical protein
MVPAVSVVVPCHNSGAFLDALLASLAGQTFRDFEIIIVNDGSTDMATLRKLDELRAVVHVLDQENLHLPGARNTGFRAARAEFILPLDCDDRLEPSYLEETVAALRNAPADVGFVFTHMRLAGALQGVLHSRFDRFDQLFLNRLPYCMLMRKSAWAAAGGYDETMRHGSEDWEFNVRLAAAGFRGVEIAKPLFIYTVRADGMLLSKSARMQGTTWKQIRERHPELYRFPVLVSMARATGLSSAFRAIALLSLAKILPEAWYNALFFRLIMAVRAVRVARGRIRAGRG